MRNNNGKNQCDYVEDSRSDRKGAAGYSVMFAAYLIALTVLAILSVNFIYFFAVLLAGFPVSGLYLSAVTGLKARRERIADEVQYNPEPGRLVETTNDQGLPILKI